eukprot:CAMPEP_0197188778 /NCGR_PEP_ID=MMETSP1423-20130617/18479_1 /TAXON_ID=476441 /ORGANISM="Pseudo-nitzschia heimii, Strain UNC1101" /LENGTH=238 /DNA_ID=CAMNT_0042640721 /DNA_START=57 /DNA_END=773 /DNA_ORIENTATION=+
MKISSLLVLLGMTLPSALMACQVTTLDGEDITEKLFVVDDATGEKYVDCMEKSKCRDVEITDCADVRCGGTEACNGARIINFTEKVLCEGLHACHRTEILAAVVDGKQQTVTCLGSGACDVAQIHGETIELVKCSGVKACRKVFVEGAKLVKCHDGSDNTPACEGFATLETNCLYCGKNGCADHINMCRFKIIGEDGVSEYKKYETCKPQELVGNCPDGLEEELRWELEGREEMDGTR